MRDKSDKQKILDALRDAPVVKLALGKTGVPRPTLYRWLEKDPKFKAKFDEAKNHGIDDTNDIADTHLIKGVRDGKWPHVKYWQDHYNPAFKKEKLEKADTDNKNDKVDMDGPTRLADALRQEFQLGKTTKDMDFEMIRKEIFIRRTRKGLAPEGLADDILANMIWGRKLREDNPISN